MTETILLDPRADANAVLTAGKILRGGGLVAIPTETVYGLGANAFDENAVRNVFLAKGRPSDNPVIVHISEFDEIYPLVTAVPEKAKKLAEAFWPGPLTIILPKSDKIPCVTSGGLDTVGIRMPSNPVARAVIKAAGVPVAAPSANISGLPSPSCFEHVCDDMNGRIDAIVDGGDCAVGVESTVISLVPDVPVIYRPGGITAEQIESVIGKVEIYEAVLKPPAAGVKAASPGVMYKHYSPKAEVTVVKGSLADFAAFAGRRADDGHTAVMCFEGEEEYFSLPVITFGREDDSLSQAARLFHALRELDETGARTVYARCPSSDGVGLAVCNRLFRAAAFRIINACPVIGLTGKTGAGKSLVASLFAEKGCVIIDCDKIARELTADGSPFVKTLCENFGEDIAENGVLDRKKLASVVFADEEKLHLLDSLTHPEIIRISLGRAEKAVKEHRPAVIDAPLLFECGIDRNCDITVAVTAPDDVRLRRIMKRDGISEEAAKARMASQKLTDAYYRGHADYVINNPDTDEYKEAVGKIIF